MKKILLLLAIGFIGLSSCKKNSKACFKAKESEQKAAEFYEQKALEWANNPTSQNASKMNASYKYYIKTVEKREKECGE